MQKYLSVQSEDRVTTISIQRPPLNIINLELIEELIDAINSARFQQDCKVLVLRSKLDNVFSAGADVKEHLPDQADMLISKFEKLISEIIAFPRPTIGVVNGKCLGGGMELALACDFVLADKNAVFGQPEVSVGVFPPIATAIYWRLTGVRNTAKIVLTGRSFSAAEALLMGLVSYVANDEKELERIFQELVGDFKSKSTVVLEFAKRAMRDSLSLSLEGALSNSSRLYLNELMKTTDSVEGLTAFIEKRKPAWSDK